MNTSPLRSPARLSKSRPQSSRTSQSLHLPGLPRFHPANYPSPSSSDSSPQSTPYSTPPPLETPPQTSLRPQHHRPYSDPYASTQQRHHHQHLQFYLHPRHGASPLGGGGEYTPTKLRSRPNSPRLNPLGSPGPVTPFDLDEGMGYLSVRSPSQRDLAAELVVKMEVVVRGGGGGAQDGDDVEEGGMVPLVDGSALLRARSVSRPGTP